MILQGLLYIYIKKSDSNFSEPSNTYLNLNDPNRYDELFWGYFGRTQSTCLSWTTLWCKNCMINKTLSVLLRKSTFWSLISSYPKFCSFSWIFLLSQQQAPSINMSKKETWEYFSTLYLILQIQFNSPTVTNANANHGWNNTLLSSPTANVLGLAFNFP